MKPSGHGSGEGAIQNLHLVNLSLILSQNQLPTQPSGAPEPEIEITIQRMLFRVHSLSMSKSNPIIFWIQESLGFTRARNLAAWGVAGGIAYYLWILPAHKDAARRKVCTH